MFDEPEDIFIKTDVPPNLPIGGSAPTPVSAAISTPQSVARPSASVSMPTPAPATRPAAPSSPVPVAGIPQERYDAAPRRGIVKAIVVFIVVAVVLFAAAMLTYMLLSRKPAEQATTTPVNTTNTSSTNAVNTTNNVQAPTNTQVPVVPPVKPVDSDGDGLTDEQEETLGTNTELSDTDADGLGDRAEVQVYSTDPKDPDTDDDGFEDGSEVSNGYNPNGQGKLFAVPGE